VVLLAVRLVVPGRVALGARLEQVALGMVPRVQAGSVELGVVALTVLLARLVGMSGAVGVQPERDDKGKEECCLWSRSLARMCANTPLQPA